MEEDRYSRQLQCTAGFRQTALSDAVVLIAGMGGLGTSASTALTAAGLGTVIVCDYDMTILCYWFSPMSSKVMGDELYFHSRLNRQDKVDLRSKVSTTMNYDCHDFGIVQLLVCNHQ